MSDHRKALEFFKGSSADDRVQQLEVELKIARVYANKLEIDALELKQYAADRGILDVQHAIRAAAARNEATVAATARFGQLQEILGQVFPTAEDLIEHVRELVASKGSVAASEPPTGDEVVAAMRNYKEAHPARNEGTIEGAWFAGRRFGMDEGRRIERDIKQKRNSGGVPPGPHAAKIVVGPGVTIDENLHHGSIEVHQGDKRIASFTRHGDHFHIRGVDHVPDSAALDSGEIGMLGMLSELLGAPGFRR